MKPGTKNSYNSLSDIEINKKKFKFYSLLKAEANGLNEAAFLAINTSLIPAAEYFLWIKRRIRSSSCRRIG